MTDTAEILTRQDVRDALAEFKVGRSRSRAYQVIRSVLRQHGNLARNIHELQPEFFRAVFDACGGNSAAAHYGVVTDNAVPALSPKPPAKPAITAKPTLRLRSPLTIDLEARLAARAGKPRSKPGGRVDIGAPAQFGDAPDDTVRDFPAGEKLQ